MTEQEFQRDMGRLIEQFGKPVYSQARVALIWREVRDMTSFWWERTVDRLIGECRQAPLVPEVREEVSRERERNWAGEKAKNRNESLAAMKALFDGQMIESICKTIGDRIEGKVDDVVFQNFTRGVKKLSHASCQHCDDSGLVFAGDGQGYEWVHRCLCHTGHKQPQRYPGYYPNVRRAQ